MRRMSWMGLLVLAVLAACDRQAGDQPRPGGAPAAGDDLFARLGCIHCHQADGRGPGPALAGLAGRPVALETGETVIADDTYLRTAILDPRAQTHAGYPPIMPAYAGQISEEELAALIAYIRSLDPGP